MEPKIAYIDHKPSAPQMCAFFPGLTPADLPDGEGWAVERVTSPPTTARTWTRPSTSTPPWTTAHARRITIDEMPLE